MIIPMALFMTLNYPQSTSFRGWSIPIATDVAIALGILSLFSYNIPRKIKIMLTSMAIIDDVGSIIVIAIFHSHSNNWLFFGLSLLLIIILIIFNIIGIRNILFYIIPGIALWFCILSSGIHATIAGVILAATIPATKRIDLCDFYEMSRKSYNDICELEINPDEVSCYNRVIAQVHALEKGFQNIRTPLDIIEHQLIGWVAFLIVPIFALANAGISFLTLTTNPFTSRVIWGIILGLVIGTPFGVLITTFVSYKAKLFEKTPTINWYHLAGMAYLQGIGFTMASFLASLAFYSESDLLAISKLAILIGSLISAIVGFLLLKQSVRKLKGETKII
jgi:NhaA family Na+:H+ antiporter